MKKLCFLLWACITLPLFGLAQSTDFNNYQILQSSGTLPLDLSDLLKEDLKLSENSDKSKRSKKDEKDFILHSTYSLNKFLRSGVVIYNDPVGAYLTQILQNVLKANGIEDDIKVYFTRSEEVNAYAMDKNFIFLTAGLLAQATNEAQLAMILSHEYIHYKNKHSRTEFIGNKAIVRDYRNYKTSSTDVKLLIASFSRELETEADQQGFELFQNSQYSYTGASEAFEVLKYSYLPFEELPYDKSFLETGDLKFPESYFLKELTAINGNEDTRNKTEEKYRTHPDIDKRIVDMQQLTEGKDNTGRQNFLISEKEFFEFRKIARFELCRLYLIERRYEDAFYSAYILLQDDPESVYLKKIIVKSLYGLTKFLNASKFSEVHVNHNKKQGESQQVNYLFHSTTKNELNLTAINYAWRLHELAPQDEEVNKILKELVYDACKYNKLTPYSLKTEPLDTLKGLTNDSIVVADTTKKTNKYVIVKKDSDNNTNTKVKKKGATFIDYAFVTLLKDEKFKDLLKEQYKKWDDDEKEKEQLALLKNKRKKSKYSEDQIDENRNITDMIVLNPVLLKVDIRSNVNKVYNASITKRAEMMNNFVRLSKKTGINSTMLNPADIKEDDSELLNNIALMNTAMNELLTLPSKITMLPTDHMDLKKIADSYNTPYLANIGVLTFVEKKYGVGLAVLMGVVTMGFLLPYTIYVLAQPNITTLVYLNVYNIEDNKFVFSDVSEIKSGGTQDLMGSTLYDMVLRMKKSK
jgi:beta-barrel assembly-enhancing protease